MFQRTDARANHTWVIRIALILYAMTVAALVGLAAKADPVVAGSGEAVEADKELIDLTQARREPGLYLATEILGQVRRAAALHTDVRVTISGPVARTRVEQTFRNTTGDWVESLYTYPLPQNAAVDRLYMTVGERVIEGEIQEKKKARETFDKARSEGKRASLVEQKRPNMFTTEITNLGPGETLVITLEYQALLEFEAGIFAMHFPMAIRPRYFPGQALPPNADSGWGWSPDTTQVTDASLISPPTLAAHSVSDNQLSLTIDLDAGFALGNIASPSHETLIENIGRGKRRIRLKANSILPDRDFELYWRAMAGAAPQLGIFHERAAGNDHALVMIMPSPVEEDRLQLAVPRELILVLDKSGSMGGTAMEQAKEAVRFALRTLAPSDRFNIIIFDSQARAFFDHARLAAPDNITAVMTLLNRLEADGGTNMSAALNLALADQKRSEDSDHLRQVVFITDGAVGNETALFEQITNHLGDSRLFTVGISSSPNSYFMREAASAGRGDYVQISHIDQVQDAMTRLFAKLAQPVLTDLALHWPDGLAVQTYPTALPDLYAGQPVIIHGRTQEQWAGDLVVTGLLAGEPWQQKVNMAEAAQRTGIAALWARNLIRDLERRSRQPNGFDPETRDAAIVKTALDYGLVSRLTSLVAVDRTPVRKPADILVASAVPNVMPDGMTMSPPTSRSQHSSFQKAQAPRVLTLAAEGDAILLPTTGQSLGARLLLGLMLLILAAGLWLASLGPGTKPRWSV